MQTCRLYKITFQTQSINDPICKISFRTNIFSWNKLVWSKLIPQQTVMPSVASWPQLLHFIVRPRPRNPLAVTDVQGEWELVLGRAWYPSLHHKFGNSHLLVVQYVSYGGGRSGSTCGCQESGENEKSALKQRSLCVSLEGNVKVCSKVCEYFTRITYC